MDKEIINRQYGSHFQTDIKNVMVECVSLLKRIADQGDDEVFKDATTSGIASINRKLDANIPAPCACDEPLRTAVENFLSSECITKDIAEAHEKHGGSTFTIAVGNLKPIYKALSASPKPAEKELARTQPCGCVLCTCYGDRCRGCGGRSCGKDDCVLKTSKGIVFDDADKPAPDATALVEAVEKHIGYMDTVLNHTHSIEGLKDIIKSWKEHLHKAYDKYREDA